MHGVMVSTTRTKINEVSTIPNQLISGSADKVLAAIMMARGRLSCFVCIYFWRQGFARLVRHTRAQGIVCPV
jgi:hypothetical protein